jgi:uncharacterized metal-binding protein YceD (DUF177 family)
MSEILSRPVRAAHVKEAPQRHVVTAGPAELAGLAAAFGLPRIAMLRGEFTLAHERGGIIAADLAMTARVTQTCVVTLEEFESDIAETAGLRFVPASRLPEGEAVELDAETLEGPDEIPYAGETIDLGAALAEQLALSLDPYPKKKGAALPEEFSEPPANPFARLAARLPRDE